jgi:hypothetical protein
MTDYPITPPPNLVQELRLKSPWSSKVKEHYDYIIQRAAQFGADQELEACCALMDDWGLDGEDLILCRRPKTPSLKEQALQALSEAVKMADDVPPEGICSGQSDIIRRALEQLPD